MTLTIQQSKDGKWQVVEEGKSLAAGFTTYQDAWAWLDNYLFVDCVRLHRRH
jgi:hypothetical protein